jgi:hypothetical protein
MRQPGAGGAPIGLGAGAGAAAKGLIAVPMARARLHKPQLAPRPNKKFFIPLQPELLPKTVTSATSVRDRIDIKSSFISKAGVNVGFRWETTEN